MVSLLTAAVKFMSLPLSTQRCGAGGRRPSVEGVVQGDASAGYGKQPGTTRTKNIHQHPDVLLHRSITCT